MTTTHSTCPYIHHLFTLSRINIAITNLLCVIILKSENAKAIFSNWISKLEQWKLNYDNNNNNNGGK